MSTRLHSLSLEQRAIKRENSMLHYLFYLQYFVVYFVEGVYCYCGSYFSGNIATYDRGGPSQPVQALVIAVITTGVIGEDFVSGPFLSSLLCLATRRQVNRI